MVKDKFRLMGIDNPAMDRVEIPENERTLVIPAVYYAVVVGYVLLTIGAEIAAVTIGALAAGVIDGIVLLILANLAYFIKTPELRKTIPAFALLPIMRILSLAIPISKVTPIYWYVLVGLPLIIVSLFLVRIYGLPELRIRLHPTQWVLQLLFGLTGIAIGLLAVELLPIPKPIIPNNSFGWILAGAVILIIFNGFTEEVIFRGLMQGAFTSIFGGVGIVLGSLIYASLYFGSLSPLTILFFGAVGLVFAIWARISHSLWGVIIAHCLVSIIFLLLIP